MAVQEPVEEPMAEEPRPADSFPPPSSPPAEEPPPAEEEPSLAQEQVLKAVLLEVVVWANNSTIVHGGVMPKQEVKVLLRCIFSFVFWPGVFVFFHWVPWWASSQAPDSSFVGTPSSTDADCGGDEAFPCIVVNVGMRCGFGWGLSVSQQ